MGKITFVDIPIDKKKPTASSKTQYHSLGIQSDGIMAPMNTLPKNILSSPSQAEAHGSSLNANLNNTSSTVLSRLKFEEAIEKNTTQIEKEAHLRRLKSLRKELDFLQNTAWKYPSIDHYIGQ